jgi:hypothetical protein
MREKREEDDILELKCVRQLGKQFEHKDNGEAANKCRTLI